MVDPRFLDALGRRFQKPLRRRGRDPHLRRRQGNGNAPPSSLEPRRAGRLRLGEYAPRSRCGRYRSMRPPRRGAHCRLRAGFACRSRAQSGRRRSCRLARRRCGVLENALDRLNSEFGSQPEDIEAAVGPAIGSCCFEVGPAVAARFAPECVIPRKPRPHVDLAAAVRRRLEQRGVPRVFYVAQCTKCNSDRFFSHRGEGAGAGRALSAIGIR